MSKRTVFIPIDCEQFHHYSNVRLDWFQLYLAAHRKDPPENPPGLGWRSADAEAVRTVFRDILAWIEGNGYRYRVQMMPYKRQLKFVFAKDREAAIFKMFFG